ncbi:Hairy/enhancer-of-split with YRPW motif protein 2 [Naganishia albida]|nr:Hairy/enhancer-of-split with YRPW motif protein 2 [Naganishia albida]
MTWTLPVDQFSPKDKDSFAYTTVVKRWPTIITNIVSTLSNELHVLTLAAEDEPGNAEREAKIEQGKAIIRDLSALKHDMGRNKVLAPIEDDGGANVDCYNDHLKSLRHGGNDTWFTASWLFAECYLYRLIRTLFARTTHWTQYDPFFTSKEETYKSSSTAMIHLAKSLMALDDRTDLLEGYERPGSALEIIFLEMMQAALWGNATDLSLLVDLKYSDLQKLQAVGAKAQAENAQYILRNDFGRVWEHLKTQKAGKVDIVLDNAGFELYTDLILADFLVSYTPFVGQVVFHPKTIPWFVSDTLPYDFTWAIESLTDTSFFHAHAPDIPEADLDTLKALGERWTRHVESGKFKLSIPTDTPLGAPSAADFWTTQWSYQYLPEQAPGLLSELKQSVLVVFKGDLNYRKLVADGKWEPTTSFEQALGPLNGQFPLVSLRTNKADPIVGLPEGTAESLDKTSPDWRVSGKYAVVSFAPRNV